MPRIKNKKYKLFEHGIGFSTNLVRPNKYRCEFQFDFVYDADIVKILDAVPNRHDYIRRVIREDIKRRKENKSY